MSQPSDAVSGFGGSRGWFSSPSAAAKSQISAAKSVPAARKTMGSLLLGQGQFLVLALSVVSAATGGSFWLTYGASPFGVISPSPAFVASTTDLPQTRGTPLVDSKIFGALTRPFFPTARNTALSAKFSDLGARWQASTGILGPTGPLGGISKEAKSLADFGAIIEGVSDDPGGDPAGSNDNPASGGPVASYPLSAAALSELQARSAQYAQSGTLASDKMSAPATAGAATPAAAMRPRGFDASEGTSLDPLRNRTYDLSYAKAIPLLK
jgi:hypothetical protein